MTRIRVQARDLLPGDALLASGRTVKSIVKHVPEKPSKVSVMLEGESYPRHWGRYTEIVVGRA